MKKDLIGFYDSGVGGLSVLKVALNKIKNKNFVFFGDTLRMPYGARKDEEIREYTIEVMGFFENLGVDLSIIACNTATSYGLKEANSIYNYPIIGVVEPGSVNAIERTKNKKVALVATKSCVQSGIYDRVLKNIDPSIELKSVYCPDLTLAIERGELEEDHIDEIVKSYLREFGDYDFDTMILGCTHYPIVEDSFNRIFKRQGREVFVVDPAYKTVLDATNILNIDNDKEEIQNRTIDFYITGDVDKFHFTMDKIADLSDFDVSFHHVKIEDLEKYKK
ncbi:glutamate racemase [Peptoniphilus porci]|uniref:Glutamate racemase n=1 Tax=Peptoniphilus porci TaxID=2652280 RepID=A0A1U7LZA0_9FIRM|nr:glutamate racemase [Peptoniphilus porci]OLR64752.1 glutamate racemase [Peptoniphilus porci]